MEIHEVTATEYTAIIQTPYHVFGSAAFNNLNNNKCDEVFYLLFREGKFRLGIIGGTRDNVFYSPFSAPFGGFTYLSDDVRLKYIEEAIKLLNVWATEKKLSSIIITLPPLLYDSSFISKQVNCLWREGFEISDTDLNYSFDLERFDDKYTERIWYNAHKNLKTAMNSRLNFQECKTDEEKTLAYNIIYGNRESRGYPLRMTLQQVFDTIHIIPADFFLVYNETNTPVASAIVFHVSQSVVQVIYWGDLPGYSEIKLMNFLSFSVFKYYKTIGKRAVDIGPSTENSIPNHGLGEFKESIGCRINPKFKFTRKIT
jgi:hypothetical protein